MTYPTISARAHANIALAKYWGKASVQNNMPAVPSVSVTLKALTTTTRVTWDEWLTDDEIQVNGVIQQGRGRERVVELLDRVRRFAGISVRARVISSNDFPTAAGLASSASAFAALALAATQGAGLGWDRARISDLARQSSASAARSLYGGFVRLGAGEGSTTYLPAEPLASAEHWDLRIVVAVLSDKAKAVGSTVGMNHTQTSSPYFEAWKAFCHRLAPRIEEAILRKDLKEVGEMAEQSALAMHASAMAAAPAVIYFEPTTLAVLQAVRDMRGGGLSAYATMDAGPHVKVITMGADADEVVERLERIPGVLRTMVSEVGGPAEIVSP